MDTKLHRKNSRPDTQKRARYHHSKIGGLSISASQSLSIPRGSMSSEDFWEQAHVMVKNLCFEYGVV